MNRTPDDAIRVFTEALQLPLAERAAYVEQACAGDPALGQRVNALLRAHDRAGEFMESDSPAAAITGRQAEPVGEEPGDRIGRYKLLQRIGEGGCGVVYMAEQEEPVRRRVALKIIKAGMDTKSVIARFEAERQALAMMDHPNIAKIFDAGATDSGRPYFVMELVRGVKITDYCDQNSVPTEERLELFIQVCQAVQHAHQKGIIHRDLKPSNILVTQTPEGVASPLVIDFGIAKATTNQRLTDKTLFTAFEMLIGTPAYMSPEQAALTSVDVDTRSDIYSLGVLLYELLTGATPFDAGELLKAGLDEIRRVIREEEPIRPSTRLSKLTGSDLTIVAGRRHVAPPALIRSVRGDLDWIAMKALEKNRARRYDTANGLALDVQRYLSDETVSARPPSALYRLQKTVSRHKALFGGLGIVGGLLVVSLVAVSRSLAKERLARQEADAARAQAEADRTKAQVEATKSLQVTQFLDNMLRGVGPSVARGRDTVMLREILDKAAVRIETELATQPATRAELQTRIGVIYGQLGLYGPAETQLRASVATYEKFSGNETPEIGQALNYLGAVLSRAGKLAEAETTYRAGLAARRKALGAEHPDVAASMNRLAGLYTDQGKYAEAEALSRDTLAMRKKLLGDGHSDTADSLNTLGIVLINQDRYAEAEAVLRENVAIVRKLAPAGDPKIANALTNLIWTLSQLNKLEESEALSREVLAMRRMLHGNEHPEVATALVNLSEVLRREKKFPESESAIRESVAIARKMLGAEHSKTLQYEQVLGSVLADEGRLGDAETVLQNILTIYRKSPVNQNPAVPSLLFDLGLVLRKQGKLTAATACYRESVAVRRQNHFTSDKSLALGLTELGDVLHQQGLPAEAEAALVEAVALQRRALREDDAERLRALDLLAAVFAAESKAGDVEAIKREIELLRLKIASPTRSPAGEKKP